MNKLINSFITNYKRERLMNTTNILIMMWTFLLLGVLITVVILSQTALRELENQAQITMFFRDDYGEEKILSLRQELLRDPRISQVTYVSKEEALRIFKEINKNEPILLESVSASVLPASLEIKALDIKDLDTLSTEFIEIDGVEDVQFFKDAIENFRYWSNIVYIVGLVLVLVFVFVSYTTVLGTLRLIINSKGTELEILKLVGASDSYVRNPLIFQGVLFGVIASLLASFFLTIILAILEANAYIDYVTIWLFPGLEIQILPFSLMLSATLVISGFMLGYLGSYFTVRKYLKY